VGARHPYGMSLETLNRVKTDAHLDTSEVRPDPDATLATVLHDGDRLALLVAVAGGEKAFPPSRLAEHLMIH
jgi:hypothetical protein